MICIWNQLGWRVIIMDSHVTGPAFNIIIPITFHWMCNKAICHELSICVVKLILRFIFLQNQQVLWSIVINFLERAFSHSLLVAMLLYTHCLLVKCTTEFTCTATISTSWYRRCSCSRAVLASILLKTFIKKFISRFTDHIQGIIHNHFRIGTLLLLMLTIWMMNLFYGGRLSINGLHAVFSKNAGHITLSREELLIWLILLLTGKSSLHRDCWVGLEVRRN